MFRAALLLAAGVAALRPQTLPDFRAQLAEELTQGLAPGVGARDANVAAPLYPEYNLSVPIDHFHNDSIYEPHSDETFNLRYWFDASYYKPGGPVIVLQGGETSGANRLPFLQKGIVAQLIKATNGLGVILEHRYYGTSFPLPDLSIESLRFLTTDQSVADMAYFAKNIVFPGLEHLDLTAPNNAYIAYGGSYAGAFVAFLRKLYPDVYWGAIASSAVTEAIYDYWQYEESPRLFFPADCISATQKAIDVVDRILIGHAGTKYVPRLKTLFGLGNLTRLDDFAATVSVSLGSLQQGTNWDPALNSTRAGVFCTNVTADSLVYQNSHLEAELEELLRVAGYGDASAAFKTQMLNYIGYIRAKAARCNGGQTQDECFTNYDLDFYRKDDIKQKWRAWPWQYCTEWGYLVTGSGVPEDQLPIISRVIDLEYGSAVCKYAFNITTLPDLERINKHGGFGLSYPRLAFIDGQSDPWRYATPHALGQPDRPNTVSEPFILIEKGVHHWDENGLFSNETTASLPPKAVVDAQQQEAAFVKSWMAEWKR
ncbi:peptidase S28 [Thozetella sp. PMI_491]|nr:peptidase S28 [Thozetella sp. PMI_491]